MISYLLCKCQTFENININKKINITNEIRKFVRMMNRNERLSGGGLKETSFAGGKGGWGSGSNAVRLYLQRALYNRYLMILLGNI